MTKENSFEAIQMEGWLLSYFFSNFYLLSVISIRGVFNGKAGKAAALPKFSDTLTLSQPGGGADYAHPLALFS